MQDTTSRVSVLDIEWKAQIVPTNGSSDAVCIPAFADRLGNAFSDEFISTIVLAKPFNVATGEFGNPPARGYDTISRILADYIQGTYKGPGRAFSPHDSHNLHSDCINILKHIMLSAKMNN